MIRRLTQGTLLIKAGSQETSPTSRCSIAQTGTLLRRNPADKTTGIATAETQEETPAETARDLLNSAHREPTKAIITTSD